MSDSPKYHDIKQLPYMKHYNYVRSNMVQQCTTHTVFTILYTYHCEVRTYSTADICDPIWSKHTEEDKLHRFALALF